MFRENDGYIVVETLCCFTVFVLLITSILSLINIVVVQTRIHYALTQAAETVSMYCYALESAGVADHIKGVAQKGEQVDNEINNFKTNINGVLDGIESLSMSRIEDSGSAICNQVEGLANEISTDPKNVMQMMLNFGLYEAGSGIFSKLIRPLVGRYLANGEMSGSEFLNTFHVIDGLEGLEFHGWDILDINSTANNDSHFLTGNGEVKLVVKYKIDYTFGVLPLPFIDGLSITQEVITKAWLGGQGEGYTS